METKVSKKTSDSDVTFLSLSLVNNSSSNSASTDVQVSLENPIFEKGTYNVRLQSAHILLNGVPLNIWNDTYYIGIKVLGSNTLYELKTPIALFGNGEESNFCYSLSQITNAFTFAAELLSIIVNNAHPGAITTYPELFFDNSLFKLFIGKEWDESTALPNSPRLYVSKSWLSLIFYAFDNETDVSGVFSSGVNGDYLNRILVYPKYNNSVSGPNITNLTIPDALGTKRIMSSSYQVYQTLQSIIQIKVFLMGIQITDGNILSMNLDTGEQEEEGKVSRQEIIQNIPILAEDFPGVYQLNYENKLDDNDSTLNFFSAITSFRVKLAYTDTFGTDRDLKLYNKESIMLTFQFKKIK